MIFDSHIHTDFSSDSQMKLSQALAMADRLGIGLISTEHMDLKYPDKDKFAFNIDEYFAMYEQWRGDKFLLGIELGMRADCAKENQVIARQAPFDYVLGSTHMVGDKDLYFPAFYEGRIKQEAFAQYLTAMHNCLKLHPFIDALAHIDYIARYAPYTDNHLYYHDFADSIDDILRLIIDNEIVLELNTRRLSKAAAQTALLPIYRRYRELGGALLTLGSDAHTAKDIGSNFGIAWDMAVACGLKLVYFKNRKIIVIK